MLSYSIGEVAVKWIALFISLWRYPHSMVCKVYYLESLVVLLKGPYRKEVKIENHCN